MSPTFNVGEIAAALQGVVLGDPDRIITGVSAPDAAGEHDLVFVVPGACADMLGQSRAGAVLLPAGINLPPHMSGIVVADPRAAMERAIALIRPRERRLTGVSPLAHIGASVRLGEGVGVGPFVCLGDAVSVGRSSEIHAGATVGDHTCIGESCVIYAGVHIYHDVTIGNRVIVHSGTVIGADGFGYHRRADDGADGRMEGPIHRKIPQIGRVVIDDDVEIGANTTIDRATLASTRIGPGTKIDNLVMVGHNSTVGRDCIIISQAGLSGSTIVEDRVTIAGQAGLAGHLTVGTGAVICAQAGVTKDVPAGRIVLGSPAEEARLAKRALPLIVRLPEMRRALLSHDKRIARLEGARPDREE